MDRNMYPYLIMFFSMIIIHLFMMLPLMINTIDDYYLSTNQIYLAIWMGFMMVLVEGFMHPMPSYIWIISIISILLLTYLIRNQIGVQPNQYLRDMITHHSMAILTSKHLNQKASNQIQTLATQIIKTQKQEINEMKNILNTWH